MMFNLKDIVKFNISQRQAELRGLSPLLGLEGEIVQIFDDDTRNKTRLDYVVRFAVSHRDGKSIHRIPAKHKDLELIEAVG